MLGVSVMSFTGGLAFAGFFLGGLVAVYAASLLYHRIYLRIGHETFTTMHDGARICTVSGDVGSVGVYKEMYLDHVYFEHGISLDGIANPVVIDAGVNIGIFSRYIAETYPTARVYGAEPIDVLVSVARKNINAFTDRVKIMQAGLGKTTGSCVIMYKPTLTSASTMHPDEVRECAQKGLIDWICGLALDGVRVGAIPRIFLPFLEALRVPYLRILALLAVSPLAIWIAAWKAGSLLSERPVACQIVTVDQLLDTLGAPSSGPIHLLKIDVEGAEMHVLDGVSDALWERIQQVVVEVHDLHGRVNQVKRFLAAKGFDKIVSDTEVWEVHKLLNIATVFARRSTSNNSS